MGDYRSESMLHGNNILGVNTHWSSKIPLKSISWWRLISHHVWNMPVPDGVKAIWRKWRL